MEYALLVPIVASLLPKQHPQMQKPLLIAHAQLTPTQPPEIMPVMGAQLVLVAILLTVPVLLAALQLISACAQPTPMEMMRMGIVLLVQMVVPLVLKQEPQSQPQWLHARAWPTRTAARRRASFVIVTVPVLPTAMRLQTACAQPTRTETKRMGHALLVQMVVPLLLKRKAEEPPQLLHARAWPTRTAARRRACFVMVRVPVLPTAVR